MSRIPPVGKFPPAEGNSADIKSIKRLIIHLEADEAHKPIDRLKIVINGFTPEDENEDGVPVRSQQELDQKLGEIVDAKTFGEPAARLVDPTPLDFVVNDDMLVVLVLRGSFWRFRSSDDAIASDKDHKNRYHAVGTWQRGSGGRLVFVSNNKPTRLISFRTGKGKGGNAELHKFYLYVDFINSADGLIMPTVIDPNVENKGGKDG
jgi:hypothetical protein